jgi:hypothetical protein
MRQEVDVQLGLFDNPEVAKANDVLDGIEQHRGNFLEQVRDRLIGVYHSRYILHGDEAHVTADDARPILESMSWYSESMGNNWLGSLFRTKDWEWTGKRIKSQTPGSHGNEIK